MKSNAELGFRNVHAIPFGSGFHGGHQVLLFVGRRGEFYRALAEIRGIDGSDPPKPIVVDCLVARAGSARTAMGMIEDYAGKHWCTFDALALQRAAMEVQELLDEDGEIGQMRTVACEARGTELPLPAESEQVTEGRPGHDG